MTPEERKLWMECARTALNGVLSSSVTENFNTFEKYSVCAFHHADAMLAELRNLDKESWDE